MFRDKVEDMGVLVDEVLGGVEEETALEWRQNITSLRAQRMANNPKGLTVGWTNEKVKKALSFMSSVSLRGC